MFLGITSHTQPKETSHRDHTSYGWAGHGQVWESGVDHNGEQGWKGFAAGDVPVFMYDPVGGHLAMMNHTLLHTMTVGPSPPTATSCTRTCWALGTASKLSRRRRPIALSCSKI